MRRLIAASAAALVLVLGAAPARADDTPVMPPAAVPAETPPADTPTADTPPVETPPTSATSETPATLPVTASRLPLREGALGWRVRDAQQRLQWLGHRIASSDLTAERMGASTVAAARQFQIKFGIRPTGAIGPITWTALARTAGRVGTLPAACRGEPTICIDTTQRLVRFVDHGKIELTLDARFGFVGAETRDGTFRVHLKSRDHVSSLYRTRMPFALFFSGGQAVHYSPYFARDGYNGASHGCVNLRDYDGARWLYDHALVGTRVHVYHS